MANDFTFGAVNLANNTRTLVYSVPTSPSGQTAVIHSCTVANTHGTDSVDVTLEVYDTSGTIYYPVSSTVPVPADSVLVLDGIKLNLEEDDKLYATSSHASGHLTVFASVLKITP